MKDLTFEPLVANTRARGLVELTSGSTAFALEALGRPRGLRTVAVTDASGGAHLRELGFRGEIREVSDLVQGQRLCAALEAEGYLWPRQMTNAALIASARGWTARLRAELETRSIRSVGVGFGTGVTAAALVEELGPAREIVAVQPAPGQHIPGLRRFDDQNLGAEDVFWPYRGSVRWWTAAASPTPASAREALLNLSWPNPDQTLVLLHDALPPAELAAASVHESEEHLGPR